MVSLVSIDRIYDREVILELERRQAVSAFFTSYMGFRWSEVQILSPRLLFRYKDLLAPGGVGYRLK